MQRAVPLMQAVMEASGQDGGAERLLEEALLDQVDPLVLAATRLGIGIDTVLERACAWLGLAYFDAIPAGSDLEMPSRLEYLGQIHIVRVRTLDRDVVYAAPDFLGLLKLAELCSGDMQVRRQICVVPKAALRAYLAQAASPALVDFARHNLFRHWPHAAAHLELTLLSRLGFVAFLLGLVVLLLAMPYAAPAALVPLWVLLLLLPGILRFGALLQPEARPVRPGTEIELDDLPLYSILVPLRDEAGMVEQLCANLRRLDYPVHRLEIIFVVEQRSAATVAALKRHLGFPAFSLVEVPHSRPLTKPKALDFALPFCRGEFVVVFDAEDRPEPGQLRRVLRQFRQAPQLHCIQARLVVGNGDRGVFPALFAGEYAGLFAVFLPALARWGVVMPLGGTSNHFRLASLRAIGGWDAYNVTEDADLGVRLARTGLACGTSSAVTYEDAPETLRAWLGQRRRWIKGWMQTILVHNRHPGQLLRDLGWWRFIAFQIVVFGMVLSPLLHTGFLLTCLFFLTRDGLAWPAFDLWSLACLLVLAMGHGIAILSNMVGLKRTGQAWLIGWQVLLPFYWMVIAWATLAALFDLTVRPFHWIKTAHRPVSPPPARRGGLLGRLLPAKGQP